MPPDDATRVVDFAVELDTVIEDQTPGEDADEARKTIQPWIEAGATGWIESIWGDPPKREERLRQGPPK